MGKDRRKKDAAKKQSASQSSNEIDSEPKGQREPRARAQQREISKNTDATLKDKTADNKPIETAEEETKKTEPVNTEELFANLKRETDYIKALTTKKFAKRQIFSNWEKYEEPPPQPQYEVDMQGADFESLLEAPASGGGHFQFKSERSWDANVSALSGELFSLDIDLLADGLATIPLYKKLDLPITLFSKDELENMDCLARTALKQYDITNKNVKKTRDTKKNAKEITNRMLDIIKESSPAPTEKNPTEDKTVLNFDIDQPDVQNEVEENVNEKEPYNNSYVNDKPEIYKNVGFRQTPPRSSKANETLLDEYPNSELKSLNKVSEEPFKDMQQDNHPSRKIKKEPTRGNKKDNVLPKEIRNEVKEEVTPIRETKKESTPPEEIKQEQITPIRDIRKGSTPHKEIKQERITPIRDIRKESTPPEEIKQERITPIRDIRKESTPPKEIKQERVTPMKDPKKESTPSIDDTPEQVKQVLDVDSSENIVQEPIVPLGQRTSRRKAKGQSQDSESRSKTQVSQSETYVSESQRKAQISESENKVHVSGSQNKDHVSDRKNKVHVSESQKKREFMESQKKYQPTENQSKTEITEIKNKTEDLESQKKVQASDNEFKAQQSKSQPQSRQTKHQTANDDLDFLLSLKKPVRESHLSGIQPSQVAKPSIDEDDATGPDSNLTLAPPQKQTEDLEDWLDSMLDD